jgi:uncharacterized protein YceK
MWKRAVRPVVVALAALLLGGCGTFVNMTDQAPESMEGGRRAVYGGVRWDVEVAYPMGPSAASHNTTWPTMPRFFFFLFDLPSSAIGDTLTLPVTIWNGSGGGSSARAGYEPHFDEPLPVLPAPAHK